MNKFLKYGVSHFVLMNDVGADAGGTSAAAAVMAVGGTSGNGGTNGAVPAAPAGQMNIGWLPEASAEDADYIRAKGWDKSANPAKDILSSYRNLEKVWGADKAGSTIMIPNENSDPKTWDAVYGKLGRPESADKYSVDKFSGMSEDAAKDLKAKAHELGLSDKQLKGIHEWNEATAGSITKAMETEAVAEATAQRAALQKEWGAAYDQNLQQASEAVKKMGWTQEQIDAMQLGLGFDGVLKLAHAIGKATGEGTFIVGDGNGRSNERDNVMTPEQAKKELNRLGSDKEFQQAWLDKSHPRHTEMINRKSQLSAWASGAK